ncbi:GerMN domain-containing protein [Bacillus sp. T33-2]|uniref:GerMN domain-containing protein n=1 Tax=Bacillus sp. T33-2 TaxID=2054168 RepID=UPI000C765ABD|nr:GerMN domain-containing protein [Bacillus sp. T33-2]PLR98067.1 sporulation protein [Bacillus sp. T33-2]
MYKNNRTAMAAAATALAASVFLSGCGLFGGEVKKEIDPPQQATTLKEGEDIALGEKSQTEAKPDAKEEAAEKTVMTDLYLIDKNGYVVAQKMELPKTESVAKQALEYLVVDGPVSGILPNGFRAVLPADTQVSVNIKDGTATVDFSKEFKNYNKEDERRILEAVTYTLTQFDSVKKVKLQMNGHELKEMPVNGTPVGETLSRGVGINVDTSDAVDISNTRSLTLYYLGGEEGAYYYVPVTKRVSNKEKDNITAAVYELVKGPAHDSNLLSNFLPEVKLVDKPVVENGQVTLNFNESIYESFEDKDGKGDKVVSEYLLNSLVLSLTEQKGIKSVAVKVKGGSDIVTDTGKKLSAPVTRPENVNTGSF